MGTPEDWALSRLHYWIRGHQLSEAMPGRCPAGHQLTKDSVLIGNHPCVACTGAGHRTWRCRTCDATWIWPACKDRPDWSEWSGADNASR